MVTPIPEQVITKKLLLAGRRLQETSRDDLVRVHILERQRHAGTCYNIEFLFHCLCLLNQFTRIGNHTSHGSGSGSQWAGQQRT